MYGNKVTYSGGSPLPTSFDETSQSKVLTSIPSGGLLGVINSTTVVLGLTVIGPNQVGTSPSSALPGRQVFIPNSPGSPGVGVGAIDHLKVSQGDSIYVRSADGVTATSGSIYIFIK